MVAALRGYHPNFDYSYYYSVLFSALENSTENMIGQIQDCIPLPPPLIYDASVLYFLGIIALLVQCSLTNMIKLCTLFKYINLFHEDLIHPSIFKTTS